MVSWLRLPRLRFAYVWFQFGLRSCQFTLPDAVVVAAHLCRAVRIPRLRARYPAVVYAHVPRARRLPRFTPRTYPSSPYSLPLIRSCPVTRFTAPFLHELRLPVAAFTTTPTPFTAVTHSTFYGFPRLFDRLYVPHLFRLVTVGCGFGFSVCSVGYSVGSPHVYWLVWFWIHRCCCTYVYLLVTTRVPLPFPPHGYSCYSLPFVWTVHYTHAGCGLVVTFTFCCRSRLPDANTGGYAHTFCTFVTFVICV